MSEGTRALEIIRSLETVRARCHELVVLGKKDKLTHFRIDQTLMPKVVDYICEEIATNYPNFDVPYHSRYRHVEIEGHSRLEELKSQIRPGSKFDWGKLCIDFVVVSVLLDAGAGPSWRYMDKASGKVFSRSEGLAIASFNMFTSGLFSNRPDEPCRADGQALRRLNAKDLSQGLQITAKNQLAGFEGRLDLLRRLGDVLAQKGPDNRVASIFVDLASKDPTVHAAQLFKRVLIGLQDIWPNGFMLAGTNVGDVGYHSQISGEGKTKGLVPFHKLSQWLTYSLLEPFEAMGYTVTGLDSLTALPEYRNGGLLIDLGLIQVKTPRALDKEYDVADELIVEWRALTLGLFDEIADLIRKKLDQASLPLAKILQGGSWSAGRKIAKTLRLDGAPPIKIRSTGTQF